MTFAVPDWFRDVVKDAEGAFWAKIAAGTPQATSGDLAPDVAMTFTDACHAAANEWYQENAWQPDTDVRALAEEFEEQYPTYTTPGGTVFRFEYMYPGCYAYHGPHEIVFFTPDWEQQWTVDIAADDCDGYQVGLDAPRYQGPLTAVGLMAIVRPWLDLVASLGVEWPHKETSHAG